MALILRPSSCFANKSHLLPLQTPTLLLPSPTKTTLRLSIKSQDSATEPQKPTSTAQPIDDPSSSRTPKLTQPTSPGLGFGSSSSASAKSSPVSAKRKQTGRRERAPVIRRSPVEKPGFVSQQEEAQSEERSRNESAFLLAWLGLGAIILVEGIALAASGFLPEEWDKFFVKYLYPSFTPTVFLFVAGTVAYGVLKYLQNEQFKSPK